MTDADFLDLARSALRKAGPLLDEALAARATVQAWQGREPKAAIDAQLSVFLIRELGRAGLPILSEEADHGVSWREGAVWIVDPLDGTLNFTRGAGPSAVSVALWRDGRPVFGVILDIATRVLNWGGAGIGAWRGDEKLRVSDTRDAGRGVLCTGIPSSFDFADRGGVARWVALMARFGKVRMIGSAASSLVLLAAGAIDCYCENSIKIWDVAAGLALAEGAGGRFEMAGEGISLDILATNGALELT